MEKFEMPNGKCDVSICQAKCCTGTLAISQYEINKIKKYIKRNNILPVVRKADICPFLNEDFKCNIYIHRPNICYYYSCNHPNGQFEHRDKHIVHFMSEFYPEVEEENVPDIEALDQYYREKVKEVYNKKEE